MISIVPGVDSWLWLWADPLPDVAVVTDNRWSWAAAPYGYDGPVLTTDGYSVWGGGVIGRSSSVVESTVDCSAKEPVAVSPPILPDLSREGPFDVHQVTTESGASPRVLDSLPGCQYRMTSYDVANDRSDFSPAYGIHLHDPRLLEYVGAPESARLLSQTPEYWLHHMGREKTLAAALQLQHDAGLIMSNIQVL